MKTVATAYVNAFADCESGKIDRLYKSVPIMYFLKFTLRYSEAKHEIMPCGTAPE